MDADRGDLEAAMAGLPDGELLRIVGVDREEYRSEALRAARAELGRRGVAIPEPMEWRAEQEPAARISGRTKTLLGIACVYTLAAKLVPDMSDANIRLSPSFGLGIVSAMLWSMAWDLRVTSGGRSGNVRVGRTWHRSVVFWAGLVTLAAVYFGSRELRQ